jgi:hypothetical protein
MAVSWGDVLSDPKFQAETPEKKRAVAESYFQNFIVPDEKFQAEAPERQDQVLSSFLDTVAPERLPTPPPDPLGLRAAQKDLEEGITGVTEASRALGIGIPTFIAGQAARVPEVAGRVAAGQPLREAFIESGTQGAPGAIMGLTPEPETETGKRLTEAALLPVTIAREKVIPPVVAGVTRGVTTPEETQANIELVQNMFDFGLAAVPVAKIGRGGLTAAKTSKAKTIIDKRKAGLELTNSEISFMNRFVKDTPPVQKIKEMQPRMNEKGMTMDGATVVTTDGRTINDIATALVEDRRRDAQFAMDSLDPKLDVQEVNHNVQMAKGLATKETPATPSPKQPYEINQLEFRKKFTPKEQGELNAETDAIIVKNVGSANPQNIWNFYKKRHPELENVGFVVSPIRKQGGRTLIGLTKDGNIDPVTSVVGIAERHATPTIVRHEIEHAVDAIKARKLEKGTSVLKESTFTRFNHATFSSDYLHYQHVKKAISEGKAVSGEILKDYPWLKPIANIKAQRVSPVSPILERATSVVTAPELSPEAGFIDIGHIMDMASFGPTPKGARVMENIAKRRENINKGVLESEKFINEKIHKSLKPAEREALPFVIENLKDVDGTLAKINRTDLAETIKMPSKALTQAAKDVKAYFGSAHEFMKKYKGEDLGFVEDYVTHLWEIERGSAPEAVQHFIKHNPFTQKRKFSSYEEGIKNDLIPKTLDIADIIRTYDQFRLNSAYNIEFANAVANMRFLDPNTKTLEPVMKRIDAAPKDWILIDNPALSRAKMIGETAEGAKLLQKVPVKVHPEIAKEMGVIFDRRFNPQGTLGTALRGYETMSAVAKKLQLSASFFHHFALTESAFSSGIGRKALSLWNPNKIYKALKNKDYEIFNNMELSKDAVGHGVIFGALPDVQIGRIQQMLKNMERELFKINPTAGKAGKALVKANELWDAALWDYYHNTLKLWAYESGVAKELRLAGEKNPNITKAEMGEIKRSVASFVNDSFGGQNWDLNRTLGSPRMRQVMQGLFLSPDWTVSTLKQAGSVFSKDVVKRRRGRKFWSRAALYYLTIVNAVNAANSQKHLGEPRMLWDNDPGHELDLFAGFNDDGTKKYIRVGKQFREVLEWPVEPLKKAGAKANPILRQVSKQFSGADLGSGFPAEFQGKTLFESLPSRLQTAGEDLFIPFSLRGLITDQPGAFLFMLPTSRGMTNFKTRKLFSEAIKDSDAKEIQRIYVAALENNLDAKSLFKSATSEIKADITYDNKSLARDIWNEIRDISPQQQQDAIKVYRDRGTLTPEIINEISKIIKKEREVQQQRKLLGITAGE